MGRHFRIRPLLTLYKEFVRLIQSVADILGYLIPFLVVLGGLVFFHELGHYWAARSQGVRVDVFSIGFGPEIFGWTSKAGTRWKVSWIPLGGYVKMWGDEDAASSPDHDALSRMTPAEKSQSLHAKSPLQRIFVSAAGPLANYVLAIGLFAALFTFQGRPYIAPIVGSVMTESPASLGGLQQGDKVVSIDGHAITRFEELVAYVSQRPEQNLFFQIDRGGQSLVLDIKAGSLTRGTDSKRGYLGIQGTEIVAEKVGFLKAIGLSVTQVWDVSVQTLSSIFQMITGKASADSMGGPLMIARLAGNMASLGLGALVSFMALLSVNLGLINLFPIPMLDGGHIVLYGFEAILGRPVSPKILEWVYRAGLGIILFVFVLTTWNDLRRLSVLQWIMSAVS